MTSKKHDKFDEFIEARSKLAQVPEIDSNARLLEWQTHTKEFYKEIESFLKPYLDKGKVAIRYSKKQIFEDLIGEYEVDTAVISVGPTPIKVDPVGTFVIG